MRTTALPRPNPRTLFPPNREHDFFADAVEAPFPERGAAFSWRNAWWLAEIALLAYDEHEWVSTHLETVGFKLPGTQPLSAGGATQCYVAVSDEAVVVAFRGSEMPHRTDSRGFVAKSADALRDVLVNSAVAPHQLQDGAWVHSGFYKAIHEVLESQLLPLLKAIRGERSLWITGHSLGGALATLAAYYLPDADGVYTLAAPRVGNAAFAASLRPPMWRLINDDDLVTCVPPSRPDARLQWIEPGYAHAGSPVHLRGSEVRFAAPDDEQPPVLLSEMTTLLSSPRQAWRDLRHLVANAGAAGLGALIEEVRPREGMRRIIGGLVDHAPIFYAVKCRNALAGALDPG